MTVPSVAADKALLRVLNGETKLPTFVSEPVVATYNVLLPLEAGIRGGSAVPRPVAGVDGAAMTTAVAAEVAVAEPAPLVAVTLTRIVEPASPEART
jgi:hypothetical protein